MKAIERLYVYFDYEGIKPTVFERNAGLSSGYLSVQKKRNADLGESVVNKINDYCHGLNIEWLITGEGCMLRSGSPPDIEPVMASPPMPDTLTLALIKENGELREQIGGLKNKVEVLENALKKRGYSNDIPSLMVAEPIAELKKEKK